MPRGRAADMQSLAPWIIRVLIRVLGKAVFLNGAEVIGSGFGLVKLGETERLLRRCV